MKKATAIQVEMAEHRGNPVILIRFEFHPCINKWVRSLGGVRWSRTKGCWYVPDNEQNRELLKQTNNPPIQEELPAVVERPRMARGKDALVRVYPVNAHVLVNLEVQLRLKGYSESTIRTYRNETAQLLQLIKNRPADQLNSDDLRRYLLYCTVQLHLSESSLHSRMNALKFYYEQVLGRDKMFFEIPRPKRPQQLPRVLSREQVIDLVNCIENLKHRTMVLLAYGCGLRVSEVVALRVADIDGDRRTLLIRRSKGKKDRMVGLSPVLLILLREYYRKYRPSGYLFEGQVKGEKYSKRSLQKVVEVAKAKVGIKKEGSVHLLRHSFATHLLDRGTDVVMIQKLLGHNDLKTTLRYLHVTNRDLQNIISPIEDIKGFLK